MDDRGLVLDIDRFATHDGPGIRTVIFMKGCMLRCLWCHSPESQRLRPELLYQRSRCRECYQCIQACPEGSITTDNEIVSEIRGIKVNRGLCRECFSCTQVCFTEALRTAGAYKTVDEIMNIIEQDIPFYRNSGGGVTISGGEPLFQADFVLRLIRQCHRKEIHIALETTGYGEYNKLEEMANLVDLIFYDIKLMDSNLHRKYTGKSNELILNNLKALCIDSKIADKILIRIPCIPNINDAPEQIIETANFVLGLGIKRIELLPYNVMAHSKYEWVDRPYPLGEIESRSQDHYRDLKDMVARTGIDVI